MDHKTLLRLVRTHGTPLVVVDHKVLRDNYAQFRKHLPRVQVYFAVKANSDPAIVKTFYEVGGSFDVASVAEFMTVYGFIKHLPAKQRQDFIWDRIIYANPIKAIETLEKLDPYKPLVTYDNHEEVLKIARRCRRIILANFAGTLLVDSVGVGLAAFGFLNPVLASLIHVSSEMVFILNSARLLAVSKSES